MAVDLAREEYERGLAEGRAEAAAEIAQTLLSFATTNVDAFAYAARIALSICTGIEAQGRMKSMEHTIAFEVEPLMDHGVPVDRSGNPSSYVMRQPTGRCTCSCGWEGAWTEAGEHIESVRTDT